MILAYLVVIVVMFVLDALWLGWLAKGFYRRGMNRAITFEVRWLAAVLFYLLHAAGILYFAVHGIGYFSTVLFRGAFFGLATYGTYNLTNLATVKNWPVGVAVLDLIWGTLLTMLAALAAYAVF